jgi:ribonuclease J
MSVSVTFLGGLGEIGRNCAVLEIDGKLALIDCGMAFPDDDMLGVDLILPDFSSVFDRAGDVECVVLTHGHEDHVGALGYFLREVPVPVYGTPLSVALPRSRIEELGIQPDLRPVEVNEWVEHGPFRFKMIPVSHSVPHGAGIAFDTPEGIIVHSGDFKLDPTPIDAMPTDLPAFAELGSKGVRLLLADSTNADRPGFIPSESSLADPIYELVVEANGLLVAACFASHLHRVQQIVDAVVDAGRFISFLGRSMVRNTELAAELGVLDLPEERVMPIDQLLRLPPEEAAVICTGSQGEPFAAISLMASGEHRNVKLKEGDTVLMSASTIPGNETKVGRVWNALSRMGVIVHHGSNARVHVSGHAAQDELRTFINVVRPKGFVPVHGEYRHLAAHADLAEGMKVPDVVLCEDGDSVVLENGELRHVRQAVSAGYVYIDRMGGTDVAAEVLRDRRHLADDGVVIVTVGVDVHNGEIVIGPDLDSHGFMDDDEELLAEAAAAVRKEIGGITERPIDLDTLRRHTRQAAGRTIRKATGKRPVLFPVVLEV